MDEYWDISAGREKQLFQEQLGVLISKGQPKMLGSLQRRPQDEQKMIVTSFVNSHSDL
jgi:hypothetical protein